MDLHGFSVAYRNRYYGLFFSCPVGTILGIDLTTGFSCAEQHGRLIRKYQAKNDKA
jgi:hypothetical protein